MIWAPPALNSSQCIGNSISTRQCCLFLVPAALPSPSPTAGLSKAQMPMPTSDSPFQALLLHPLDQWRLAGCSRPLLVQPLLPKGVSKPSLGAEDLLGDRKRLGNLLGPLPIPVAFGPCPQCPSPSNQSSPAGNTFWAFLLAYHPARPIELLVVTQNHRVGHFPSGSSCSLLGKASAILSHLPVVSCSSLCWETSLSLKAPSCLLIPFPTPSSLLLGAHRPSFYFPRSLRYVPASATSCPACVLLFPLPHQEFGAAHG